jgi:hypothetical protein
MPRRVLGARVPILLAVLAAGAERARAETPALSHLLPAGNTVPACAKLLVPPAGSNEPCGATSNPYVARDGKFVACMASMLLQIGKTQGVNPQQASEAGIVVYQSRAEMGLLAVSFPDTKPASDLAAGLERQLAADPPPTRGGPRSAILRKGSAVGFAACDSMFDDACCAQMLTHLRDLWSR